MADEVSAKMGVREYLQLHSVKFTGLLAGGALLVAGASAETFNFTILSDLTTALVGLIPDINSLVNEGGPVVINFCIVAAVCGPFIWIAKKAGVL